MRNAKCQVTCTHPTRRAPTIEFSLIFLDAARMRSCLLFANLLTALRLSLQVFLFAIGQCTCRRGTVTPYPKEDEVDAVHSLKEAVCPQAGYTESLLQNLGTYYVLTWGRAQSHKVVHFTRIQMNFTKDCVASTRMYLTWTSISMVSRQECAQAGNRWHNVLICLGVVDHSESLLCVCNLASRPEEYFPC